MAAALGVCTTVDAGRDLTNPSVNYDRFAAAFEDLNRAVERETGLRPFLSSRDLGDGMVEVVVNELWVFDVNRLAALEPKLDAMTASNEVLKAAVRSLLSTRGAEADLGENVLVSDQAPLSPGALIDNDVLEESIVFAVYNLWSGLEGTGLPVAVYVVEQDGRIVKSISRGLVD